MKPKKLTILNCVTVAAHTLTRPISELFKTIRAYWRAGRAVRNNEKLFAKWDHDREAERLDRLRNPAKYL